MKVIHCQQQNVEPVVVDLPDDLAAIQRAVGGPFTIVPLDDPPYVAVVNEEGELRQLPTVGPFFGPWFIAAKGPDGQLRGLTDEDVMLLLGTPLEGNG